MIHVIKATAETTQNTPPEIDVIQTYFNPDGTGLAMVTLPNIPTGEAVPVMAISLKTLRLFYEAKVELEKPKLAVVPG